MYASSNKRDHSFIQTDRKCEWNCQGIRYFQMDSLSLDTKVKNSIKKQNRNTHQQHTQKEINQAPSSSIQTFSRSGTSYHQSSKQQTCRSKKTCIQVAVRGIIKNNSQTSQKKRIPSQAEKLQATTLSEWQSYETI